MLQNTAQSFIFFIRSSNFYKSINAPTFSPLILNQPVILLAFFIFSVSYNQNRVIFLSITVIFFVNSIFHISEFESNVNACRHWLLKDSFFHFFWIVSRDAFISRNFKRRIVFLANSFFIFIRITRF